MKAIKLYCVVPNADATSLYRGMGPLSRLREHIENVDLIIASAHNWSTICHADVVFMQRPYRPDDLVLANMVKAQNKPLWVDYDDDLFQVPPSNPAYAIYGKEEIKRIVGTITAMADVVTVSTYQLKKNLEVGKGLNGDIRVIPNALNEKMFWKQPDFQTPKNPIVLWRGTATHDEDLLWATEALADLSRKFDKVSFTFLGRPFWLTIGQMNRRNTIVHDPVDSVEFFDVIQTILPLVMIVPLKESKFNLAKSNIAWIEASYAGAATLAPRWDEWMQPGCYTYRNAKEFHSTLEQFLSQPDAPKILAENAERSWKHIKENYTLGKLNHLRAHVIQDLLAK